MSSTPRREVTVAAVKRLGRALATPSGALAAAAGMAGLWAVAGLAGARIVGGVAIGVGVGLLLYLAHDGNVRAREAVARAKAARDVADQTTRRVHLLNKGNAKLENTNRRLGESLEATREQLANARRRARAAERRARVASEVALEVAATLRSELEATVGAADPTDSWDAVAAEVADPVLSIAIPVFNGHAALQRSIEALLPQVTAASHPVEVVIIDDASTDFRTPRFARDVARATAAVGFRRSAAEIGLEQRRIAAAADCRGGHVWTLESGDIASPGAVATILADLTAGGERARVLLYTTASAAGEAEATADQPIARDPGATHVFPALIDLGRTAGLEATVGRLCRVVVRRDAVAAVDPTPFLGLTMTAHLAVMLVAFADQPVHYRNSPIAVPSARTRAQELVEAAGRPEESFMAGGPERDARWFGAGYAALLQRVSERTGIPATAFADHVERRWSDEPLVDWIERNWARANRRGITRAPDVVADASSFFAALGRPTPRVER